MLAVILVAAIGLALTLRGLRGIRLDDHPLCRRCGYDLYGAPGGTSACTECGADLSRPGATRVGHRRPRRPSLILGLGLILVAAVQLGIAGRVAYRGVDWQRVKPVWMLIREGRDGVTHAAALNELIRRLETKCLSPSQVNAVADAALGEQGRVDTNWRQSWGDFVEAARALKRLPDDRWKRYADQALQSALPPDDLHVRPPQAAGTLLPISLRFGVARLGKGNRMMLTSRVRAASGDFLAREQQTTQFFRRLQVGSMRTLAHVHHAGLDSLQVAADPGIAAAAAADDASHPVTVTVEALVTESLTDPTPLASRVFTMSGTWTYPQITPEAQSSR